MGETPYPSLAKTWTSHNVEFHQISFEDNREFCKDVLGITKLLWTQVLAPSRGHAEVIADGSSIGKLESSLQLDRKIPHRQVKNGGSAATRDACRGR